MGFGHRVYKTDDPRSLLLRSVTEQLGGPLVEFSQAVERTTVDVLAELKPGRQLYTNVEFYAGVVMHTCGIPREMFTPTFAAGRTIGWSTHVMEQAAHNRLIRPAARYVGPPPPQPVPLAGGLNRPREAGSPAASRAKTRLIWSGLIRFGTRSRSWATSAPPHGHAEPGARALLVPQPGQRGLGPTGGGRRRGHVRADHRPRPAQWATVGHRLRLRGPGADRADPQPARPVRDAGRHAHVWGCASARWPGPPKRFAQGIGVAFSRDRPRPHRPRLLDGRRGRPRPPRRAPPSWSRPSASASAARSSRVLMRVGVVPEEVCERCNDIWATHGAAA